MREERTKGTPVAVARGIRPRVLVIPNTLFFPPYLDGADDGAFDDAARPWIMDVDADLVYLDQRLLTDPSAWRRRVYRRLPMRIVQMLEAFRVGRDYDVVFCWSVADITLGLAFLLKLTGRRLPLVALLTRVSERKKALLLKRVHSHIERIILPPIVQREFASRELGVPSEKFFDLPWTLDTGFWRSSPGDAAGGEGDAMICAAGGEMRDYVTLVRALEGTGIRCHIAGVLDTSRPDWWNATDADRKGEDRVPENVTFGTMTAAELRSLYDRSRFVVVPLHPTDSDNGITCMNEAWAMGKPVIVSAVNGQRGAFTEGREGLWVSPEDPDDLREAIIRLWNDPQQAVTMGAAGREMVVATRSQSVFSEGLSGLFREMAAARLGRRRLYR